MRLLTVAVLMMGCAGADAGKIGIALLATSEALVASGISRASGGCYASCPVGTQCNGNTGMCETIPCRGQCGYDETCVNPGWFDEHCEHLRHVPLQTNSKGAEPSHDWP